MTKTLYIVEGEIEERFFSFLIQNDYIAPGRINVFNLMQNELHYTNAIFTKRIGKIFAFLDTDRTGVNNLKVLENNVSMLKTVCPKHLFLLIQNQNFEDELRYMLSCKSLQALCNTLGIRHCTKKDMKTFLSQSVHYDQLISRKHLQRYCTRQECFLDLLPNSLRKLCVSITPCLLRK
mgnify:CR=1 FL=1